MVLQAQMSKIMYDEKTNDEKKMCTRSIVNAMKLNSKKNCAVCGKII